MWNLVRKVICILIIGLILLNSEMNCLNWKYAVTTPKEIKLFDSSWNYTQRIMHDTYMTFVSVFAFDEKCNIIYYANNNFSSNRSQIYKLSKFDNPNRLPSIKLVQKANPVILGMAFDSISRSLYWSNGNSITRYDITLKSSETFLANEDKFPTDIAIGTCSRDLYYINQKDDNSTIEAINVDTKALSVLDIRDLITPRSITVDCVSKENPKLYWLDTMHSTNVRIEEAYLNGQARRVVFTRSAVNPIYLTTDKFNIYYSSATYKKVIQIDKKTNITTIIDHNFGSSTPFDILTKHNNPKLKDEDCSEIANP